VEVEVERRYSLRVQGFPEAKRVGGARVLCSEVILADLSVKVGVAMEGKESNSVTAQSSLEAQRVVWRWSGLHWELWLHPGNKAQVGDEVLVSKVEAEH
jgi:hypothetical protein